MSIDGNGPAARIDDPANRADERRLASAIRAEQRENLARHDVERDALQRLIPRGIGLGQVLDGDDRSHRSGLAVAGA